MFIIAALLGTTAYGQEGDADKLKIAKQAHAFLQKYCDSCHGKATQKVNDFYMASITPASPRNAKRRIPTSFPAARPRRFWKRS